MKRLMSYEEAEILANSVIQQFSEMPLAKPARDRITLDPRGLTTIILRAKPIFGSSRMQFRVREEKKKIHSINIVKEISIFYRSFVFREF